MRGIGGNVLATLQRSTSEKNAIGERVQTWETVHTLRGWLDLMGGESKYANFNMKIQESTHIFVGDYVPIDARATAENSRLVIGGKTYDIMLIDNPMGMGHGSQLEIYLKYTGGQ